MLVWGILSREGRAWCNRTWVNKLPGYFPVCTHHLPSLGLGASLVLLLFLSYSVAILSTYFNKCLTKESALVPPCKHNLTTS
jgi:hypothetical protein